MKIATIREVRNEFSKLELWLAEGETIEIRRRGVPVGHLTSPRSGNGKDEFIPWPDLDVRRKAIWGERFFSQEELDRMEAFELEGQEG
jgi:antitoxin (DNA-binding transcriptional repressor) of toxin-antitoxin stability system